MSRCRTASTARTRPDPDPGSGGAPSGVTYILFKDSRVSPIEDHGAAVRTGRALAEEFVRGG